MVENEQYARCRECFCVLTGILDQRILDYCKKCAHDLGVEEGRRVIPLHEAGSVLPED